MQNIENKPYCLIFERSELLTFRYSLQPIVQTKITSTSDENEYQESMFQIMTVLRVKYGNENESKLVLITLHKKHRWLNAEFLKQIEMPDMPHFTVHSSTLFHIHVTTCLLSTDCTREEVNAAS